MENLWILLRINNLYFLGTVDYELLPFARENGSSNITILEDGEERLVQIEEQFEVVKEAWCPNPQLLNPDKNERDRFQILSNGSLFFTHLNDSGSSRLLSPMQFCIIPVVSCLYFSVFSANTKICPKVDLELRGVVCHPDNPQTPKKGLQDVISDYILICIISISCFFLLLNVIAFFVSPDLKSLHGLSIAGFSGSFLVVNLATLYFDYIQQTLKLNIHNNICMASGMEDINKLLF